MTSAYVYVHDALREAQIMHEVDSDHSAVVCQIDALIKYVDLLEEKHEKRHQELLELIKEKHGEL